MPAAAAIPWLGTAIAGVAGAGSALVGAKMQSNASQDAATMQTNAANHAADVQDQAAQRAEAFQRQQAENEWLNSQNTQRANYEQNKARYGSIAGVASQYGLNLGGMPDYAPGIDPHYDSGATPTPPSGSIAGASAGAGAVPADLQTAMQQANQIAYGGQAKHTDPSYWQALWSKDPEYAYRRMLGQGAGGADVATSGPYAGAGTAAAPKAGTIAASPYMSAPSMVAPTVNTPIPTPYQPGTIASYGRMR